MKPVSAKKLLIACLFVAVFLGIGAGLWTIHVFRHGVEGLKKNSLQYRLLITSSIIDEFPVLEAIDDSVGYACTAEFGRNCLYYDSRRNEADLRLDIDNYLASKGFHHSSPGNLYTDNQTQLTIDLRPGEGRTTVQVIQFGP